jgi:hypothetical protein
MHSAHLIYIIYTLGYLSFVHSSCLVVSLRLIKDSCFVNFLHSECYKYDRVLWKLVHIFLRVENLQNFEKSILMDRLNRHIFMWICLTGCICTMWLCECDKKSYYFFHIMGSLKHRQNNEIYLKCRTDERKMTRVIMFEIH